MRASDRSRPLLFYLGEDAKLSIRELLQGLTDEEALTPLKAR